MTVQRLGLTRANLEVLIRHAIGAAVLAMVGCFVGLAVNQYHPMSLPMTLTHVPHSGVPRWVWDRISIVTPEASLEMHRRDTVIFMDVRDTEDFDEGHVPGAIHLPYHEFSTHYDRVRAQIPTDAPVLIYCYGSECGLSMRVAKLLLNDGWDNLLLSMIGGFEAWEAAEYPIEPPPDVEEGGE